MGGVDREKLVVSRKSRSPVRFEVEGRSEGVLYEFNPRTYSTKAIWQHTRGDRLLPVASISPTISPALVTSIQPDR